MGAWGRGALEVGASAVSGGSGPGSRVAPPGGTPGSGARAGSGGAGARAGVPGAAAGGRPAEECGRAAGGAAPPPGAARAGRRQGLRAGRGRERESGRAAGGPRQGVAAGPTGPRGRWAAVGSCCPCPETPRTWPGRAPSPGFSWAGRAGGGGRGRAGGVGRGRHHRRPPPPPAARPHLGGPPARTWAGSSQPRAGRWERKRGRVHGGRAGLPELGARGRRGRVCRCGHGRLRSTPAQEEPSGKRRRARVEPAQAGPTCSRPRGLAGVRRGCRAWPGPFPGAPVLGRHGLWVARVARARSGSLRRVQGEQKAPIPWRPSPWTWVGGWDTRPSQPNSLGFSNPIWPCSTHRKTAAHPLPDHEPPLPGSHPHAPPFSLMPLSAWRRVRPPRALAPDPSLRIKPQACPVGKTSGGGPW